MTGLRRLSPSQLTKFTMCQIAWERQYLRGQRSAPSFAMWIGSAVDLAVRENLDRVIRDEEPMDGAETAAFARSALQAKIGSGEAALLTAGEAGFGLDLVKTEAGNKVAQLAAFHREKVLLEMKPVATNERMECAPEGYDFSLLGYLDTREEADTPPQEDLFADPGEQPEGPLVVVSDLKTKANLCKARASGPNAGEADASNQLTTYGIMVREVLGLTPHSYRLDFLVCYKNGPEWRPQTSFRTEEDFDRVLARYQRMTEIIDGGLFWPAEEGHWSCAPDRCSFWADCEFGARGRRKPSS